VNPRYAMFMLAAPVNQRKMRGHVRGTAYLGINLKDVRGLAIPVPPTDVQLRIVEEIVSLQDKANEVHDLQRRASDLVARLVPSVLSTAFSGVL
jgi:restriction endonuclease S subunit